MLICKDKIGVLHSQMKYPWIYNVADIRSKMGQHS